MKQETLIKKLGNVSVTANPADCYQQIKRIIKVSSAETQELVKDLLEAYIDADTAIKIVIDSLQQEGITALRNFSCVRPTSEDTLFIKEENNTFNIVTRWRIEELIKQLILRIGGTDRYAKVLRYIKQLKSIKIPDTGPYDTVLLQLWHLADTYSTELGDDDAVAADIMDELFDAYVVESAIEEYITDQIELYGVKNLKNLVKRADMTQKALRIDSNGNLITITKTTVEQVKGQFMEMLEDAKND